MYNGTEGAQEVVQFKAVSDADRLMIDDRPNRIETWKQSGVNPLMNVPEGMLNCYCHLFYLKDVK